jgi:Bacterial Ig-like domain (group 3)/FG-GAP-like repeat
LSLTLGICRKSFRQIVLFAAVVFSLVSSLSAKSVQFLTTLTYDSGALCGNGITVADVNGDGKPDVILASGCPERNGQGAPGTISVQLGNGDGTFRPAVVYGSGGVQAMSVQVADVDGDGKVDVLVANECDNDDCLNGTVGVLLGNGDGTFQPAIPVVYSVARCGSGYPVSLAIADVNGDRKPDVVVGYSACVNILLGSGGGTFQPPVSYFSFGGVNAVAVSDVNHDGKLDVVVADACSDGLCTEGGVGVFLGNGDGTFQPASVYGSNGFIATSVQVADVNGDGNPDILVLNQALSDISSATGSVGVLFGKGDGTFQPGGTYESGDPLAYSLAVGDLNGDGKPDLAIAHCTAYVNRGYACPGATGVVGVLVGNGDGTFQPTHKSPSGGVAASAIAIADINGDRKPDLVVANRLGEGDPNGDGTLGVLLQYNGRLLTTSIAFTSSVNPSRYGQAVTFSAVVTSTQGIVPDGEVVMFFDGEFEISTGVTTSGVASFTTATLRAKKHIMRATYSGDATFKPSTKILKQVVSK